jgi:hypothetical protein
MEPFEEDMLRLQRYSTLSGSLLGLYSVMLLTGAAYIQQLYGPKYDADDAVASFEDDAAVARGMGSKLSFTVFPAVVLAWLSYSILSKRPWFDPKERLDHLAFTQLQAECKALLERTNLGRMLSNIFAVVSVDVKNGGGGHAHALQPLLDLK